MLKIERKSGKCKNRTMQNDQQVPFHCQMCGECCSGDMRVFLNPHDLDKIRDFLGLDSNPCLLDKGIITLEEGQHGLILPRIAFKASSGLLFCPFLENRIEEDGSYRGCCRLHPARKPLVCALAPMARELDLDSGAERYYFQEPVRNCPGMNTSIAYRVEKLFPQVAEELEREKEYYTRLQSLLEKGHSPHFILEQLFHIVIPGQIR